MRAPRRVWLLAGGVFVVIGAVTVLRHRFFLSSTYDMGFYVHNVWQIGHGNWTSNIFGFHVFADHFSPLMILLAPLAYIGTAYGLLAVQAAAIASTVVPAFRLGRAYGGDRLGWMGAGWLALSAAVWHTVMYDFRPATLGFVALIWLIAEMETDKRVRVLAGLAVLAASSREDVAVLAGLAMLMQAFFVRSRLLGVMGTLSAGVGIWYSLAGQRLFAPFEYFLWYRYADYGATPADALGNLAYAVPTALERLVRPDAILAVLALLVPFLLMPAILGIKRSWPALLIIAGNAVSADPFIPTIYFQYYIACVPFLIWAAVHVYARPEWRTRLTPAAVATVCVFLLAGPVLSLGPVPYGRSITDVVAAGHRAGLAAEIQGISETAGVSAGNIAGPHLADREEIFSFPLPLVCSSTIVRYTPQTTFPSIVVVQEHEEVEHDIDLRSLGYVLVKERGLRIWESGGDHPAPTDCPSPEATRLAHFENIGQRWKR